MSDCSNSSMQPYDVARLCIEFQDGEVPWMYPLALNGRTISGVYVDNERYERVVECEPEWDGQWFRCGFCGERLARFGVRTTQTLGGVISRRIAEPPKHCPNCGAKVVDVDGE